jgi:glycosyltransferase involved in cell wall biosynthesis
VTDLGAHPDRITVAPWGIDSDLFIPGPDTRGLRSAHGLSTDDVVLLSTRSWEPLYDVPTVVEGVARARRSDPRIRLVLGGDGSMRTEVRDRLESVGLSGSTVLTGRLSPEAVRDWLRAADAYVSAATTDGTSLSLLEAHSCGLPVVVPDVGGNPEWVTGPDLGELFVPGDADSLAEALLAAVARSSTPESVSNRRAPVVARGDRSRTRPVFLEAVDRAMGAGS